MARYLLKTSRVKCQSEGNGAMSLGIISLNAADTTLSKQFKSLTLMHEKVFILNHFCTTYYMYFIQPANELKTC